MFKDKLKEVMEQKQLNSAAVSAITGLGPSSISQYLSGKVNPPDKKKQHIALALGLDANYFTVTSEDIERAIQADGGYRLSVKTAAKLMGIDRETLYNWLEDGTYTFGRIGKNKGSSKRNCWISRILFTEETGIPVPIK